MTEHYPYPRTPYRTTQWYIRTFLDYYMSNDNHWWGSVLTIFGQHDLAHHSGVEDTPLWTMEAAGMVAVVSPERPYELTTDADRLVTLYGHNYNVPMPETTDPDTFNILMTHQMISDKDYWNGQVKFSQAKRFLQHHKQFDLIVCGDNHNHFLVHDPRTNRYLINCGSIMRSTIAQRDHKPMAYVFDLDTQELTPIEIPIRPSEEVFSPDPVVIARTTGMNMAPFVQQLQAGRHGIGGMDFVDTLWNLATQRNANDNVKIMLEEVLHHAHQTHTN